MHNWDDYRVFLAIANSGSVSAAAEQLGVNQSTVSRRINVFEEKLNMRLFERLSTGYALTQEGFELKQYVSRIEEETLAIERHLEGNNIELSGSIRITTSLVMLRYVLMPSLKEFSKVHPAIELHLDLSNNLYNLNQREADVAIRVTRDPIPENLIARELGYVDFAVYGEKKYLQAYYKNKTVLYWIGEDKVDAHPDWLPVDIGQTQRLMRCNDVLATADAIKYGLGVGRLPTIIGDKERNFKRMEFEVSLEQVPVYLVTHVEMRRVNRVRTFNDFIADAVRETLRAA